MGSRESRQLPNPGAVPAEAAWERPRRRAEPEPDGTRWARVALWAVATTVLCGGYLAFAPESAEEGSHATASNSVRDGEVAGMVGSRAEGFELLHASWGSVHDEAPTPAPPPPSHQTEWQKRERAFQQMGRERWKGTEIFVRRRER